MMENKTKKTFHICADIDEEIQRIATTWKTVFDESPINMLAILEEAKNDGKKRYAGCDNMREDGRCGGHELII